MQNTDEQEFEESETVPATFDVKEYLNRLRCQEEWADTEWLPGDLL